MGEPVHRRHAFDSRQLPYLLPYGASGARRRELLEIAVVHVQEAKMRAVHFNAEDDLYDSGLVSESWCRRQNGNVSVYRSTTRPRGVDGGRFNRRQPRKGLLQKLKREGMSVHRGFAPNLVGGSRAHAVSMASAHSASCFLIWEPANVGVIEALMCSWPAVPLRPSF